MHGYRYRPHAEEIESRRAGAMDVLAAIAFGVLGALFFFFWLSA
jgi:hypothetical protein